MILRHTLGVECAIYYPSIVPPSAWLRQSLLYYDVVGSVVPDDFDEIAPADLLWLEEEGHYETIHADGLGRTETRRLLDEFLTLAAAIVPADDDVMASSVASLRYGKLPPLLSNRLADLGLLHSSDSRQELDSRLIGPLVCLLAKYATAAYEGADRTYSMHTLQKQAQDICHAPTGSPVQRVVSLTLTHVLPRPSSSTSYQDIVDFRQRHQLELAEFRLNAESAAAEYLSHGDTAVRSASRLRQQIELERDRIARAMRRKGWTVAFGSAIATALSLAAEQVSPTITPWVLSGVGPAVISAAVTEVRRGPSPKFSYLHLARENL